MSELTAMIDGFGPISTEHPSSAVELGEVVRDAVKAGHALYPVGGGTHQGLGMSPNKPGRSVDLTGMNRILDFPARDMTVTVQAGIRLIQLRDTLAAEKLRLPIDVPQADRATLGGAIAVNASGPLRCGFGTLRDFVIGISAVNDEGAEFKAGGRVVKNVAGYDLCKLLVGSLGTLGIITQATLKLRPLAEEQALVWLTCDDASLTNALNLLHTTRTRPVCMDLLNHAAAQVVFQHAHSQAPTSPWTLLVGFEGNGETVNWQVQRLIQEVGTACKLEARLGFTAEPLWKALAEKLGCPQAQTTFKANLLPSGLAEFCLEVARHSIGLYLQAHAANGIVLGQFGADVGRDSVRTALIQWRELAAKAQGRVIVQRCPPDWKNSLSVWGPAPADAWLMRIVKNQLDPQGVFNPGRFVDGI